MKIPVLATAIVAAAVAAMIGLGVWQLQRATWKEGLLVRYAQAAGLPPIAWPNVPPKGDPPYFRRATGFCLEVVSWRAIAGRNLNDEPGWSHIAACRTGAEGPGMQANVGWSRSSDPPQWRGGALEGVIAPDSKYGMRLIAAKPAPGLVASAPPSPESIPNNHLAYAIQWFIFAAIAAVIYVLALRRRHKETPGR
jgi:surfeit locus 1 family protein